MQLQIYNVTNYIQSNTQSAIQLISITNIAKYQGLAPQSQCTNLIILEENRLLANCLSSYLNAQGNPTGVSVLIDFKDMQNVKTRYFVTGNDFNSMKDGEYRFLKKFNYTYIVLVKRYSVNCFFNVVRMDGFTQPVVIKQISMFDDPIQNPNPNWQQKYIQDNLQPQILPQDKCSTQEGINLNAKNMTYLEIEDIQIVPFAQGIVVASDFNYGLLFMNITCNDLQSCSYLPHFYLQGQGYGEIYVMDDGSEKVIFVQKLSPPQVLEVNMGNPQQPFFQKAYLLSGDVGNYLSIDVLAANKLYIITHLYSVKTMKPVMRIFKRNATFFSTGYAQHNYIDFLDSGVYSCFLSLNDGYFLLKTSGDFRIMRLQPQDLVINASNFTRLNLENYINNTFIIILFANNYQQKEILTSFEVLFVDQYAHQLQYTIINGTNKSVTGSFECSYNPVQEIDIEQYFSGPKFKLSMQPYDEITSQMDIFQISYQSHSQSQVFSYKNGQGCFLPGVIALQSSQQADKSVIIACMIYGQSQINLIDAFNIQNNTALTDGQFVIPMASIVEFDSDMQRGIMFVLSNQTTEGKSGIVIHFFKFFNILQWDYSIDLIQRLPWLNSNFKLKAVNSLSNYAPGKLAVLTSDPYLDASQKMMVYQHLVITFTVKQNGYDLVTKGLIQTRLPAPLKQGQPLSVDILKVGINSVGLFIGLTNNTINLYVPDTIGFKSQGFYNDTQLPNLTYKFKQQYQLNQGIFANKIITTFKISEDIIIAFADTDIVYLLKLQQQTYELMFIMQLPIYNHLDQGFNYQFVYNKFFGKVENELKDNNLLIFTCMRVNQSTSAFESYYLFGFDITKSRHNTLLFKERLNATQDYNHSLMITQDIGLMMLQIDPLYYNLRVVQRNTTNLKILINLSKDQFAHFNFVQSQTVSLIKDNAFAQKTFLNLCQGDNDITLRYYIYPQQNPEEKILLNITVQNNGKIFYLDRYNDSMALSRETSSQNFAIERFYGRYSTLSNFHGQDLTYNVSCISGIQGLEVKTSCDNIMVSVQSYQLSKSLDFLGSTISLLSFFAFENLFAFFDPYRMNVYIPQTDQYLQYGLESVLNYSCIPMGIFILDATPLSQKNQTYNKTYLMVSYDNNLLMKAAFIYTTASYDTQSLEQSKYLNVNDQLYILQTQEFTQLTLPISLAELYVESDPMKMTLVTIQQQPQAYFESRVTFFHINVDQNLKFTYQSIQSERLTVMTIGVNTFRVNSIALQGFTLFLGIENFGFVVYDMARMKLMNLLSVQSLVPQSLFQVSHIVAENDASLYLVLGKFGLIQVNSNSIVLNDRWNSSFVTMTIQLLFNSNDQTLSNGYIVKGPAGFAYLDSDLIKVNGATYLQNRVRFIGYYARDDSKSVGRVNMPLKQGCMFLQKIPFDMVKSYLIPQITSDYMVLATVCGGTEFEIIAFNFQPQITVNISQMSQSEFYTQYLEVETFEFNNASLLLQVDYILTERQVSVIYYLLFIIALALLTNILIQSQRRQITSKDKDSKKIQRPSQSEVTGMKRLSTNGNSASWQSVNMYEVNELFMVNTVNTNSKQ